MEPSPLGQLVSSKFDALCVTATSTDAKTINDVHRTRATCINNSNDKNAETYKLSPITGAQLATLDVCPIIASQCLNVIKVHYYTSKLSPFSNSPQIKWSYTLFQNHKKAYCVIQDKT